MKAVTILLMLAGTRTQFNTAEPIEFALLCNGGKQVVPLEIRHADGSAVTVPVPFDAPAGKAQSRLVRLRPGALKAGEYVAAVRGAARDKAVTFAVHPAEHANAYWTAQWVHHGARAGTTRAKGGWMYMTSDLVSLHPRTPKAGDLAESYVAARMRPFALMILGGGHQLDLDLHNDWGDPWVQRAIVWRMQLGTLSNRLYPMTGLHCYDEPGLTWWPVKGPDGKVIGMNPYAIPHQLDEFKRLTGKQMPDGAFEKVGTQYAGMMDAWLAFLDMRMKYLEQAWVTTMWATKSVHPPFTAINQVSSSYSPSNVTDGVDGRQSRPYEIVSGHGGYSDRLHGTFQPVHSAEAFQSFSRGRPHVYLPMWYTHDWATIRNAVWMSWTTKLEGMMYTPEQDFGMNYERTGYLGTHTILEIAEVNRRMALVGGVMNQLAKTPAPVAVLWSHRQSAWDIATYNSPKIRAGGPPAYYSPHRGAVDSCFFRVMETGMAPNWIDEAEAVEKGAKFLGQWKVIFCPRLTAASPAFRKVLEAYTAAGGKLIQCKGDTLRIKGSIIADHGFGELGDYAQKELFDKAKAADTSPTLMPGGRDLNVRKWDNSFAPTFAKDLAGWIGEQPFSLSNKDVLLGVHKAGAATYLLMANNAMDTAYPRGIKHELVPAETDVKLPARGVVYDLFDGGRVAVSGGEAKLKLAAGAGACWLRLPRAAGKPKLSVKALKGGAIRVELSWGKVGYLPFRLRVLDPGGKAAVDLYRATTPGRDTTTFTTTLPLGANAAPGQWTVEVSEWLTGSITAARVNVRPAANAQLAGLDTSPVSVYFDDARKIMDLFAGKAAEPPYKKMNWDSKRVFSLHAKRFAVFGPVGPAAKIAAALKAKGMTVQVNPAYKIVPFQREPGRGGAGPSHGATSNYENIHAHSIVLGEHALTQQSIRRGHVNRPVTAAFPGPSRAYVQWGSSCYQAGWQNVFVLGDADVGAAWLLKAIAGKSASTPPAPLRATVKAAPARRPSLPARFTVAREIPTYDTPVGVAASPDGKTTYVALYDGSAAAYDAAGKRLWARQVLIEGAALALSPKGDRLAVAGHPGVVVLNAADGKVLGGWRAKAATRGSTLGWVNRIISVAWNSAGTMVAAGGSNQQNHPQPLVILDAKGQVLRTLENVAGNVMGVAFVPGGDVLLVGADKLTAIKATDGATLWTNGIKGASSFAFGADGKTAAAGGWGKSAGTFRLADGKIARSAGFDSVVGGVALAGGDLIVAVWGGTHPLYAVRGAGAVKPVPFFASRFGFQNVLASAKLGGLVAAEQGGRIWLLGPAGKAKAVLDEDAGTTAYRLIEHNGAVLVARMSRAVQHLAVK